MFFLMLAWAFMCVDLMWPAFAAILAATVCIGIIVGSFAYDVFHRIRNRRKGGK